MGNEIEKAGFMKQFESLRPDLFFPESWTSEQKADALEEISPSRTKTNLYSSIPMTCRGEKCVYAQSCPLLAKNLAPVSKPCPIEMAMVSQFAWGLIEELNVDPDNLVEVSMVRDLVDQEVQTWRSSKLLGQEDMIQENVVGLDSDGRPIIQKDLHKAVDLQDRILKRKKDLRNQLMATREKKAQIGLGKVDSAIALANIFQEVREIETERDKMLKTKLGILDENTYIKEDMEAQKRLQDAIDAKAVDADDQET